ncbi:MAG TPA: hemerythrin domain-containing protein [Yinghuangia sp.]|uniref:hemerythrin domain-containing protein n=1 Tax=Yinghuangia sp. YIM S10712 TaxID=3436930 RepID=UPI002BF5F2D9|nr:hemerythrin domain-containing protein [Yinghuangia sp.]
MRSPEATRTLAAGYHHDDVLAILLLQHARIQELFAEVKAADGDAKQRSFDELRRLLAVHETAEEMIVRPAAKKTAGPAEADARNDEERQANKDLAMLEDLHAGAATFDAKFAAFEKAVLRHADREESEEFPALREGCTEAERRKMGSRFRIAEKAAPTHPHPTAAGSPAAQWTVGPFAALADRIKDALSRDSGR